MSFDLQPLGSKFSAQNSFSSINVSYSALEAALRTSATTADDTLAVNALPSTDPSGGLGFNIPTGQARALGLDNPSASTDDAIVLNSTLSWTYGQDAIGAIEHEITEGAMGRVGSLGYDDNGVRNSAWAPMDLYRFTAQGQRDYTGGTDGVLTFFGTDPAHVYQSDSSNSLEFHNSISRSGGRTVNDGFDLADWGSSSGDAFGPGGPSSPGQVSAVDLKIMDVLGWTPGSVSQPADDYANGLTDGSHPFGQVSANSSSSGTLEVGGDRDWFAVQLAAGVTYVIDLQGQHAGGGTLEDPYVRLHDSSGALLAENDDIVQGVNRDSKLSYTPSAPGQYYIEAGAFADSYVGTYTVRVTGGSVTTPNLVASGFAFDGTTASWQVGNTGSGSAAATSTGLYLSTDAVITTADTLLASSATPALTAGATDPEHNTLALPGNLTPGTYYLGAVADYGQAVSESSESDNASSAVPVILGGAGGDALSGASGVDVLLGMGGNDTLDGGAGNDTLDGGAGANTASYASAASAVTVSLGLLGVAQNTQGAGIDTLTNIQNLTGSGFNDDLTGNGNANVLHGGNGADTLRGQAGDDAIFGEAGNDYIEGGDGNDTIDGGAGFNIAAYASASAGVVVNLGLQGVAQDTQGAGIDTISNVENLIGSNFNDDLSGDGQTNALYGGNGNDTLRAQAGDDNLFGQAGNDYIEGGDGNDVIDGGTGFNVAAYATASHFVVVDLALQGVWQDTQGAGNDLITNVENLVGSDFNDTLSGDAQSNALYGSNGDDTLYGRAGDDNLFGQAGNDYIEGGDGNDVIDGGSGFNLVAYATASHFVVVDLSLQGQWQDTQGAGNDFITNVENLIGSDFDDNLTGDGLDNVIYGGNGNDTLYGKAGNDNLFGGNGNDYIDGGTGNDILTGNSGSDAFVFGASFGHDTVTDFTAAGAGHDRILLLASMFADFAAVQSHMTQSGSDVVISDGLGDTITLSHLLTTDLSAGDFTFI